MRDCLHQQDRKLCLLLLRHPTTCDDALASDFSVQSTNFQGWRFNAHDVTVCDPNIDMS